MMYGNICETLQKTFAIFLLKWKTNSIPIYIYISYIIIKLKKKKNLQKQFFKNKSNVEAGIFRKRVSPKWNFTNVNVEMKKKKKKKMKEPTGFESMTFDQKARPIPA